MNNISTQEKDAVLFEIVRVHPNNCFIDDDNKNYIAKKFLLPDRHITVECEYDQDNLIAYKATVQGINFISKGGYVKVEKDSKPLSFFEKIKKNANKIAIEVIIAVVVGLILYYIFGIKSS
ncbi:hypothetical protein [uncultured Dysgonomonas sp.]|uniref:Uncharacterized protein n=1 Tax=uncultured Dysgonomonas sp. TaxID=206096 RepID=A0A212IXK4_9BACT|nr:hypothetical protein [uncultured Dysgonomonas sp.]SBV91884.1 hypothetical protein KL86DYS1_10458 [uncultured Dysgonomonas sp.]